MVTDRELNAMMADGLLNTVRDAAKSLYGENQTYPCDDVKRMAAEVERLRAVLEHLRAELNEHGGRYWEARYRDEAADNDRLRAALEEILNYSGGAFCVCDDQYVMERARAALGVKSDSTQNGDYADVNQACDENMRDGVHTRSSCGGPEMGARRRQELAQ